MSSDTTVQSAAQPTRPPARTAGDGGRTAGLVLSSLAGLFGVLILLGGVALIGVHGVARDDDGYYTTETEQLTSDGYAVSTGEVDFGETGGVDINDLAATLRIDASSTDGKSVFVGIASVDDAERYLAGVDHSVVSDLRNSGPQYDQLSGGAPKAPPAAQDFWVASSTGTGEQTAEWTPEAGKWAAVVMNADAGRDVAVDVDAGAKISWLIWVGIGLTLVGLLISGVAGFAISRLAGRKPSADAAVAPSA